MADVEEIVREIQAGRAPEENFQRIFARYFRPVANFFANRGLSEHEAEDLAQDALFRVYTNMEKFRFEARFETWLFQVVANVWKNAVRSQSAKKRRGQRVSLDEIMDPGGEEPHGGDREPGDPVDGPLEQILADERSRLLYAALDQLPPKMREYMLLRVGQGLKYQEIAAVTNVSIATVKTQIRAAQERLKVLLERHSDVFAG